MDKKLRDIDNEEIVDSIMAVTLQCGLTVEKIEFKFDEETTILLHVKDAKRVVVFPQTITTWTLCQIKTEMEKQLHD